jgi:hypothetical protein
MNKHYECYFAVLNKPDRPRRTLCQSNVDTSFRAFAKTAIKNEGLRSYGKSEIP